MGFRSLRQRVKQIHKKHGFKLGAAILRNVYVRNGIRCLRVKGLVGAQL